MPAQVIEGLLQERGYWAAHGGAAGLGATGGIVPRGSGAGVAGHALGGGGGGLLAAHSGALPVQDGQQVEGPLQEQLPAASGWGGGGGGAPGALPFTPTATTVLDKVPRRISSLRH